jgi:hypothetical protein
VSLDYYPVQLVAPSEARAHSGLDILGICGYNLSMSKAQARMRVNNEVAAGRLPRASSLTCTDCGKPAEEYDHYLGYEPEHYEHVQPVCKSCHIKRENARGSHARPTSVGACIVCGKSRKPYTHGRCPRCWAYYNAYGVERPERLWNHEKPTHCVNCGVEEWKQVKHFSSGRCWTCAAYLLRTGRDRPEKLWRR